MAKSYPYRPRAYDPAVPLLAITAIFAIYGPTFDAVCATGIARLLFWMVAILATILFAYSGRSLADIALSRYKQYIERPQPAPPGTTRAWLVKLIILAVVTVLTLAPIYLTFMGLFETLRINLEDYLPHWLLTFSILGVEPLGGLNIKGSSAQASISSLGFCGDSGFHWTSIAQLLLATFSVALVIMAGRRNRKNPKIPFWFPLALSAGILERRVYWDTRLGILLEESFERHFGNSGNNQDGNSLYSADMGVIFNTAITAHPCLSADLTARLFEECDKTTKKAFTVLSGGRLILTNLQETDAFDRISTFQGDKSEKEIEQASGMQKHIAPDVYLPYRVVDDDAVKLTTAAALNANFPPVFFDAPVEIRTAEGTERYYVTDGGATENRGLISLLYALKHTLKQLKDGGREIPGIHIVMAEASATGHDYHSELGISTATSSAKEIIASGLINELLRDARQHSDDIHVTYLNMPAALRSRGGLGTHWMMPGTVKLISPYTLTPNKENPQEIDARDFKCTMDILYGSYEKLDEECKGFLRPLVGGPEADVNAERIKKELWLITEDGHGGYKSPDHHLEAWEAFSGRF